MGVMSGTSCDGIDVALVDVTGGNVNCLATHFEAYSDVLKARLLDVISGTALTAREFADLDYQLAKAYAESVLCLLTASNTPAKEINSIGLHGQTIDHQPPFNTWQLGSAAHVAALTGIDVVADFRTMDVALGGQGAPLAPALHQALFFKGESVAVLNLGGIANLTHLTSTTFKGFDTGPANCLMDLWINKHKQKTHDEAGAWAATGSVDEALLARMMDEPYFAQQPPKSTGRELFNQDWLDCHLKDFQTISAVDVQATLLQLTAQTVIQDIKRHAKGVTNVFVCGGGVHNKWLMQNLSDHLPMPVLSSKTMGIDPDHVESILMAWLAAQHPEPINLSTVTGAQVPHVFGTRYRAVE